jgi:hypothetical protein
MFILELYSNDKLIKSYKMSQENLCQYLKTFTDSLLPFMSLRIKTL